jgi:hypothetical protein
LHFHSGTRLIRFQSLLAPLQGGQLFFGQLLLHLFVLHPALQLDTLGFADLFAQAQGGVHVSVVRVYDVKELAESFAQAGVAFALFGVGGQFVGHLFDAASEALSAL